MWLFLMVNVGTYTSPMDGMGFLGGNSKILFGKHETSGSENLGGECDSQYFGDEESALVFRIKMVGYNKPMAKLTRLLGMRHTNLKTNITMENNNFQQEIHVQRAGFPLSCHVSLGGCVLWEKSSLHLYFMCWVMEVEKGKEEAYDLRCSPTKCGDNGYRKAYGS